MRENKKAILITSPIIILSLLIAFILTYCIVLPGFLNADFIINCSLGIFTGAFLSLIISIINYNIEKKKSLVGFVTMIGGISLIMSPMFYLFKNDAKRNIEVECNMIEKWEEYFLQNLPLNSNSFCFFLGKCILSKKVDSIINMLADIYSKVNETTRIIKQYQFDLLEEEELIVDINKLFMYLRNYNESEDFFTNILSSEQEKLCKIGKLKFTIHVTTLVR